MADDNITPIHARRRRDLDETVDEVQRQADEGQFSPDLANLAQFLKTQPGIKNLRVYTGQGKPLHVTKTDD